MTVRDKIVVLTGASSGFGEAAARRLSELGATVVPVGRSTGRTAAVAAGLGVEPIIADFTRLAEVRGVADAVLRRFPRIDVLVNNAGCIRARRTLTVDDSESTFQVNALAPYLLTRLLVDRVRASHGRLINTSSQTVEGGHPLDLSNLDSIGGFEPYDTYAATKVALALLTREFARRFPDLAVADFHPGVYVSQLAREMWRERVLASAPLRGAVERFVGTPEDGVRTLIHLIETDTPLHGEYYKHSRRSDPGAAVEDRETAAQLWDICARRVGLPS